MSFMIRKMVHQTKTLKFNRFKKHSMKGLYEKMKNAEGWRSKASQCFVLFIEVRFVGGWAKQDAIAKTLGYMMAAYTDRFTFVSTWILCKKAFNAINKNWLNGKYNAIVHIVIYSVDLLMFAFFRPFRDNVVNVTQVFASMCNLMSVILAALPFLLPDVELPAWINGSLTIFITAAGTMIMAIEAVLRPMFQVTGLVQVGISKFNINGILVSIGTALWVRFQVICMGRTRAAALKELNKKKHADGLYDPMGEVKYLSHQGKVWKKGVYNPDYKERHLVLFQGRLEWYKYSTMALDEFDRFDLKKSKPQGTWSCEENTIKAIDSTDDEEFTRNFGTGFGFILQNPKGKTKRFMLKSESHRDVWITQLQEVIDLLAEAENKLLERADKSASKPPEPVSEYKPEGNGNGTSYGEEDRHRSQSLVEARDITETEADSDRSGMQDWRGEEVLRGPSSSASLTQSPRERIDRLLNGRIDRLKIQSLRERIDRLAMRVGVQTFTNTPTNQQDQEWLKSVQILMTLDIGVTIVRANENVFKHIIVSDVATAVGGDSAKISVTRFESHSNNVLMTLHGGVCGRTRSPLQLAHDLEQQAQDPFSLLRQGTYSSQIISVMLVPDVSDTPKRDAFIISSPAPPISFIHASLVLDGQEVAHTPNHLPLVPQAMMGANNLHRAGSPPANARNAADFESLSPQNVPAAGAGWNGLMSPHHCLTTPGTPARPTAPPRYILPTTPRSPRLQTDSSTPQNLQGTSPRRSEGNGVAGASAPSAAEDPRPRLEKEVSDRHAFIISSPAPPKSFIHASFVLDGQEVDGQEVVHAPNHLPLVPQAAQLTPARPTATPRYILPTTPRSPPPQNLQGTSPRRSEGNGVAPRYILPTTPRSPPPQNLQGTSPRRSEGNGVAGAPAPSAAEVPRPRLEKEADRHVVDDADMEMDLDFD